MVLKAFTEYTQGPLEVQYEPGGKVYRIPPITIEAAATLHAQAADPDAAIEAAGDRPSDYMPRLVLGDLWDEMKADKIDAKFADRVYLTALADFQGGREYAEHMFAEGIDPKVVQTFLEGRQQQSPKAPPVPKRSPRTGAAGKTPSRASSTTTKTSRPN